jgi:hypothetical protein
MPGFGCQYELPRFSMYFIGDFKTLIKQTIPVLLDRGFDAASDEGSDVTSSVFRGDASRMFQENIFDFISFS